MPDAMLVSVAILLAGVIVFRAAQGARDRRLALVRIGAQIRNDGTVAAEAPRAVRISTYPPRFWFAAPAAAVAAGGVVYWGTALPAPYTLSTATLVFVVAHLIEMQWAERRIQAIEAQLADSIDLLVASLRAGASFLAGLEATLRAARPPMRDELERIVGSIRLGEDPREAFHDLARRVPLESFRLFVHTVLVHWETGGSLVLSLRTVGRTVRDRLEVSRRISAQAVESQVSVMAVMGITYGLTLIMLNTHPGPLQKLIFSRTGSYIAAGMMILEAIGIVWIWQLSRIRF